jgi:hypothetical protein
MTALLKLALPLALAATGCVPTHEYEGTYEMTYDVILKRSDKPHDEVRAGQTIVEVRGGQASEYLIDLGSDLCRLTALHVPAKYADEWPYLDIRPQTCWFRTGEGTYELQTGGTATLDAREERFSILLAGAFSDAAGTLGSATLELTETW